MPRTVYLGTSEFAATVLRPLAGSPHRPALVVTPPDRRQGRGRKSSPPPAATAARDAGLELAQTDDASAAETVEHIRASGAEVAVVCAFGQIIREPLLSAIEMLNVHPSLLPRWRGAAPIERAIMAGDERTGVSIMRVGEGLDSGPVVAVASLEIDPGESYGSLSARLAELGAELLLGALDGRGEGSLELREQDKARVTYAEKITDADRRLDPGRPATELERVVRALTPHIGAYLPLPGDDRLGVRRASALAGSLAAGELAEAEGELRLGCADGVLALEVVQPPGGRPMAAEDYLRGHGVPQRAR